EAEGAEVLDVALQGREVEIAPELVARSVEGAAEMIERLLRHPRVEIERRVAQKRCGVVGVGTHAGVLEVDDMEPPVPEHQVPRLEVAMAVNPRQAIAFLGPSRVEGP